MNAISNSDQHSAVSIQYISRINCLLMMFIAASLSACNPGMAPGTPTSSSSPGVLLQPPAILPATNASPASSMLSLTRLTNPGCCVQPFWSADGQRVLFIDKPEHSSPAGIYGVSVDGGTPQLVSEQIGMASTDGRYMAYLNTDGQTIVEEAATGSQTIVLNKGRRVVFSPNSQRLAWGELIASGNVDQQGNAIKVANIDSSQMRRVAIVYGEGIVSWLDDDTLLLLGKDAGTDEKLNLFTLSVIDGTRVDLASQQHIGAISVAPGGEWIAYDVTLDPDGPEEDGLWVTSADGSQQRRLDVFGSFDWQDATHLLVVPLEIDAPSHRLLQIEATTGQVIALTDPATLPFRIAGGDWCVSPTGEMVVFRSAGDQALWLLRLEEG